MTDVENPSGGGEPVTDDPVMDRITAAVTAARAGDATGPRATLVELWNEIGADGDALHRCTLAHYLADMYDDPARALVWDVRALDAADALTDSRAERHHAGLQVAGFYPSLHLNLADNFRRLSSFDAAREHLDAARARLDALPDDDYRGFIGTVLDEITDAVDQRSSVPRPSAPTP